MSDFERMFFIAMYALAAIGATVIFIGFQIKMHRMRQRMKALCDEMGWPMPSAFGVSPPPPPPPHLTKARDEHAEGGVGDA